MRLEIANYLAASFLLEQEPGQWDALVLLDSGMRPTDFVARRALSYLYLHFDDIEQSRANKLPPTSTLVGQALQFAKGKERLLVSCRAGQGCSVALAYLICCRERGVAEAVRLLDPTRHRPNRLVVTLGDALLDDPEILTQFDAWQRANAHIRLSDYIDEIEREFEALEAAGAVDRISGV
jgi:predicted protein tyrosine phosphatase